MGVAASVAVVADREVRCLLEVVIVRKGNDACRRDNDVDADGVKDDVDCSCKVEIGAMRRAGATKASVDAIDAATITTAG